MRNKYSVSYHYPVKGQNYSTSIKYRFKTWIGAYLTKLAIKAWCSLKGQHNWCYMSYISKYGIDTDLGVSYQDIGPWRSYQLTAYGDSFNELLEDASISEIDQDGGELAGPYPLEDATNEVHEIAIQYLTDLVYKKQRSIK